MGRVGSDRRGVRLALRTEPEAAAAAHDLNAGGETFQVTLLFVREVDREEFELHGVNTRNP